jgi:hypothetical protein
MIIKPTHLNVLLVALVGIVLVPAAIVVASRVLGAANESAGFLHHKLPEVFFWIFLATGVSSPFLGIGTLVLLWILRRRRTLVDAAGPTGPRMHHALVLAAVTAIVAPVPWAFLFSEVFFVAGGNR